MSTRTGSRSRGAVSPAQQSLLGPPTPPPGEDRAGATETDPALQPLADRLRPRQLDEVVGQRALLGPGGSLRRAIESDRLHSMILWGPPGSGKTTVARLVAVHSARQFESLSAVLGGIADLRRIAARAQERRQAGQGTVVFVDEIHRFNRAQQDAFLPHIESGQLCLIGATTENPSFSINAAILSRAQVYRLDPLSDSDLVQLLERALRAPRGLGSRRLTASPETLETLAALSRGDARRGLSLLEIVAGEVPDGQTVEREAVTRAAREQPLLYDKVGEEHYNVVSALIKSMRGSDPDASVYWLMRMLEAGDDPLFVLRRLLIFASEDVGNADPRALPLVVAADQAYQRVGMPEGVYPIAHACLYLACCPKSNAIGKAFVRAREEISKQGALPVPLKLRNAVTGLMESEGYGESYRYPHDEAGHFAAGETYLPDALSERRFYEPAPSGFEQTIAQRLKALRTS